MNNFVEIRNKAIAEEFAGLNEMQMKAVMATEGPVLVLAGAGSGKTTVLVNRIANLIRFGRASDSTEIPSGFGERELTAIEKREGEYRNYLSLNPVEPWRILAITFTNRAALEMKTRLASKLGQAAEDIWACTFHSACVRILRRDAERLGYTSSFTIYDTDDSISLLKNIIKDLELDSKEFIPRLILSEISRSKDSQINAADYSANAGKSYDKKKIAYGKIYVEYSRRMFASNAMDFDDLIANTVKLLQNDEDSRAYWQRRFKYILIDEYQDTNQLQYLLASLLTGEKNNLCVVGDDDQSIYKFRGATIDNILNFEKQFKGCRTIRLEQNYRSTGNILDAANAVISNNISRKGKTLWTNKSNGDKVQLYTAADQDDEARFIAKKIMKAREHGNNWRDFAVLYRMNAQSASIENAFKRNAIPYRLIGGTKFFERAEVKDILSYLITAISPDDDLRLIRIINSPARGIGKTTVERLQALAAENNESIFSIIGNASDYPELRSAVGKLSSFYSLMKELSAFAECNSSDAMFDFLLEKNGYVKRLEEKNTIEDTARAENVREIKSGILSYIKETADTSVSGYLASVALFTDTDNYSSDDDAVVMMTVHSAKGLEFPTVFLAGMEETIFPGIRAMGNHEELEEERRLCYVAITRAMNRLYIISAMERMLFGKINYNKASRFVEEIPEENTHSINKITPKYQYSNIYKDYPGKTDSFDDIISYVNNAKSSGTKVTAPGKSSTSKAKNDDTLKLYNVGDKVKHKLFGEGEISAKIPMGGDFLVEIIFVETGKKKLMLKTAAQYLTKIE